MASLEERVDRLEEMFARFLEETSRVLAGIHEEVAEIRASNARTDRQLLQMQQQADKDRHQVDKDRQQAERDRQQAEMDRRQAEKDRQQAEMDRQQAEKERKEFNRRLAEITDAQGLLIENMVWPNLKRIAGEVFAGDDVVTQAIRIKRLHPTDRGRMKEVDLLAVSPRAVLVCEAKSKPTSEKVREFLASLETFKEFFPEYRELTVVPMIASIAFDPSLVSAMTSQGVLALGFADETMELLNPEVARRVTR